jgi:hypothetical protein
VAKDASTAPRGRGRALKKAKTNAAPAAPTPALAGDGTTPAKRGALVRGGDQDVQAASFLVEVVCAVGQSAAAAMSHLLTVTDEVDNHDLSGERRER